MLIKWITCEVVEKNKMLFSKAQEQWIKLKGLEGFIGQIGGWNEHNEKEACILAVWESKDTYLKFMKLNHDKIYDQSNQQQTYESISVDLYDLNFKKEVADFLNHIDILQITECQSNGQDLFETRDDLLFGKAVNQCDAYLVISYNELPLSNKIRSRTIKLVPEWAVI